ncbi:CLUMA_CG012877, isoform A [Clunio marinus]|uniref:acireductone dioxygenase (Fe(2+)-requiring) n=1 Tax=Clunio marinus TaxID=568069 RepID=A0A1J1IIH0_9DIPT|nr:CLUMA_CG012877, isoform A [Clunio marinus]
MVRAWFMDDDITSDLRLEHHRNLPEFVDVKQLFVLTRVKHYKLDLQKYKEEGSLYEILNQRGYFYEDEITDKEDLLSINDEKMKGALEEHLHTDEEIHFVVECQSYYDVREALCYFIGIPSCPTYHRPAGDVNCRKNYLKELSSE